MITLEGFINNPKVSNAGGSKTIVISKNDKARFCAKIHKFQGTYRYNLFFESFEFSQSLQIAEFVSQYLNTKFLKGLSDYYAPITNGFLQMIDNNKHNKSWHHFTDSFRDNNIIKQCCQNSSNDKADRLIKKHENDEFTQEIITKILLHTYGYYPEINHYYLQKKTDEQLEEFPKDKEYFENNKPNYTNIVKYLIPGLKDLTDNELTILESLDIFKTYYDYKYTYSISSIKLLHQLCVVENSFNKDVKRFSNDTKIMDVTTDYMISTKYIKNAAKHLKKYPLNKTIEEYVKNFTVGEYFTSRMLLSKNYSPTENDFIIKTIINNPGFYPINNDEQDIQDIFTFLINYDKSDNEHYERVKQMLYRDIYYNEQNGQHKEFQYLLCNYVKYLKRNKIVLDHDKWELIKKIYFNDWIKTNNIFGQVIVQLLQFTTVENVVKIFEDVMNSDKKRLSSANWIKFIDNFEDYKNMPVSWWIELL